MDNYWISRLVFNVLDHVLLHAVISIFTSWSCTLQLSSSTWMEYIHELADCVLYNERERFAKEIFVIASTRVDEQINILLIFNKWIRWTLFGIEHTISEIFKCDFTGTIFQNWLIAYLWTNSHVFLTIFISIHHSYARHYLMWFSHSQPLWYSVSCLSRQFTELRKCFSEDLSQKNDRWIEHQANLINSMLTTVQAVQVHLQTLRHSSDEFKFYVILENKIAVRSVSQIPTNPYKNLTQNMKQTEIIIILRT